MITGPWDRYGPFSEALCRVPDLKCLDIGANGCRLRTEEGGRVTRIYELFKHKRNLEIIRSTEGTHFTIDVVRTLKRTCCPHLREMPTDIYSIQYDRDWPRRVLPWGSSSHKPMRYTSDSDEEEVPPDNCPYDRNWWLNTKVIPNCDGVIWKDGHGR